MSEHVSGNRLAIEAALDWLDALDGQVRNLAAAIKPAIHQDCLGDEAQRVILARVSHEARMMLPLLRNPRYEGAVSPQVVALVGPLLVEAGVACFSLWKYPRLITADPSLLERTLRQLMAPTVELSHLRNLLVDALGKHWPGPGVPSARRQGRRCRLRVDGRKILLDDQPVQLNVTAERRSVVLRFLNHLIGMAGDWISGPDIDRAEERRAEDARREGRSAGSLAGTRWDKVRSHLPECLSALVESRPGAGHRLKPSAWRN